MAAAFVPSEFAANDRQANLLRDIRLASVVHGMPEAIPLGPTGLLFVRQSPAESAPVRSVTWRYYCGTRGDLDDDLYDLVNFAMRLGGEMFPMAVPYGPRFTTHFWVLKAKDVKVLQAALMELEADRMEEGLEEEGDVEVLRSLVSVVNDAVEMREPILLRAYNIFGE